MLVLAVSERHDSVRPAPFVINVEAIDRSVDPV